MTKDDRDLLEAVYALVGILVMLQVCTMAMIVLLC